MSTKFPWLALVTLALCTCEPVVGPSDVGRRTLRPYPRAFGPGDPLWTAQPHRDRPLRVAVTPDRRTAIVTLQGLEDEPGHEVVLVDIATRTVRARVDVGSSPTSVAVHPAGRFAVVTTRFENRAAVLDLARGAVAQRVAVDFYATDIAFTPDGAHAWVSNRWRDEVVRWDLVVTDERFDVLDARARALRVATHPRDVALSSDGATLAVASLDGLSVHLFASPSGAPIATTSLHAPVNDVLFAGPWLIALTQGGGSGHPPLVGPDTDEDGRPGDSTANVNFQDQQNEIAVIRASDGAIVRRYTSDTTCCRDFRDVAPEDPRLGEFVADRARWIVGGSIPEAGALCDGRLWVAYLGSSEVQTFDLDVERGELRAAARGPTPHGATGIACVERGAAVVSTLAERLSFYEAPDRPRQDVVVGDVRGGEFPATDQEIGELVNVATAPFTVDGDQSCVMCHREFGNLEKPFSMPLLVHPEGTRMTMPHRGLADTRPWFFESAMDENNFFPVLNEFARIENFCCTDPQLWTTSHPAPADCELSPPPECSSRPYPRNLPSRNAFYLAAASATLGRTRSIGDAFDLPLNFQGITRAIGLSLLHRSRLLPNPNDPDAASVQRGRALFESTAVGCSACHRGAGLAASTGDAIDGRVRFGPVVSPLRSADGRNLDTISDGFIRTFPETVQQDLSPQFGAPTLRGIWAHSSRFLHDGRARSLREVVLTPGHAALRAGERGFNETEGVPNTHGATSHLSANQIDDLVAFMEAQ
ncbi:MAG: beta-propeller fold lactonase family protein [Polyangiales bacterium]